MNLALNLKKISKAKKISVTELARQTGVRQNTIHGWANGRRVLNLDDLKKVADVLEVSLHMLLYGEPDPHEVSSGEILKELFSGDIRLTVHRIERRKPSK